MGDPPVVEKRAVTVDEITVVIGLLHVLTEDHAGDQAVVDLATRTVDRLQSLITDDAGRTFVG